jgi:hypothetical protein
MLRISSLDLLADAPLFFEARCEILIAQRDDCGSESEP